ncbi:hypothetical protein ACFQY5_23130 [Paeniroseomonas aquatica]|uniref:PDC sensor domain-containing protein n=1 Tax=Paeniroseomonas aquatica TaxID=373043 RepID=UPI00361D4E95
MVSAVRLHQAVLAAALLVPALVFGAAAWWNRADVLRGGTDAVERTTSVMHEHVAKVFETADLILDRAEDHLRGLPRGGPGPGTSEFLSQMKAPLDHIVSIWVSDASGQVLAGSQAWDRSVSIADREFFRVHRDQPDLGTHVSGVFSGRATTVASFAISRRRSDAAGGFAGVIHVSFSPAYFSGFFAEAAPPFAHSAGLFRADGAILAKEPGPPPGSTGSARRARCCGASPSSRRAASSRTSRAWTGRTGSTPIARSGSGRSTSPSAPIPSPCSAAGGPIWSPSAWSPGPRR